MENHPSFGGETHSYPAGTANRIHLTRMTSFVLDPSGRKVNVLSTKEKVATTFRTDQDQFPGGREDPRDSEGSFFGLVLQFNSVAGSVFLV